LNHEEHEEHEGRTKAKQVRTRITVARSAGFVSALDAHTCRYLTRQLSLLFVFLVFFVVQSPDAASYRRQEVTESTCKVPAVTLGFWIIKIAATTLGETGGDTVTMTMDLGYLAGTGIFLALLILLVALQIAARKFHPLLYWATIVASTTLGTTLADFADRSLGIGYAGGSALLLACVIGVLALWYWRERSVSVETVATPRVEAFYWATITASQTLGTALGDWMADDSGLGYLGAALVFLAAIAVVVALYRWTAVSHVALFWTAFILTRPLGATVGDFFDKPLAEGGLDVSRPLASAILLAFILACIVLIPQRPAAKSKA
jgi:uncharacterized membrane-anchored protein